MTLKYGSDGYPLIFSAVSDGDDPEDQVVRMSLHADALDGHDAGHGPKGLPRIAWDFVNCIAGPNEPWLVSCRSDEYDTGRGILVGDAEDGRAEHGPAKDFTDTNDAAVRWLFQNTSDPRRKNRRR